MKLSISNIAWSGLGTNQVAQRSQLTQNKISFVELAPALTWENPDNVDTKQNLKIRDFWHSSGVSISALQSLFFGRPELQLFGDEVIRKDMSEYIWKLANSAAELGAPVLVFGSPTNRRKGEMSKSEADSIAIDFFSEINHKIEGLNVVIAIEPNPTSYLADYLVCPSEVLDLLQRLNCKNIRMNFDLACTVLGNEDPVEMLNTSLEHVAHIHISEPNLEPISNLTMPHEEFANAIHRNKKHLEHVKVSMEMRDPTQNPKLVSESIAVFKEIYEYK
jgi:D-psicose/D-tagatose/L-ribulose 3-epimerase